MKFRLLLTLLFVSIFTINAQNTGTISGKVIDNLSKTAVPYANVSINKDNKIISGGMTLENGSFVIKDIPLDT
jgi:hypothetical protein